MRLSNSSPSATVPADGSETVSVHKWDPVKLETMPADGASDRRVTDRSAAPESDAPEVAYTLNASKVITNRTVIRLDRRPADADTGRMPVQWAVDTGSISIAWWSPDPAVRWRVRVDDRVVATTTATTWTGTFPDNGVHGFQIDGVQVQKTNEGTIQAPFRYAVTNDSTGRRCSCGT